MLVKAYAKVNLILNILGKRADGYHEIESIMQADENLYDEVYIEEGKCDLALDFGDEDLAYKAMMLMRKEYNLGCISVRVIKNIPIAAGLGGGSADAAAVITGICKIEGIDLSDVNSKPYRLAAKLGADVPFCLASQNGYRACICRGIGEKLSPIKPLDIDFEYIFSNLVIENKTKRIYEEFDKIKNNKKYDIEAFLKEDDLDKKLALMGNMLQEPLENITGQKRKEILCGAGPTYFMVRSRK